MKKITFTLIMLVFALQLNAHTYSVCHQEFFFRNIVIRTNCDITFEDFRKTTNYKIALTGAWFIQTFYPEFDHLLEIRLFLDPEIEKCEISVWYDNLERNMFNWYLLREREHEFEFDADLPLSGAEGIRIFAPKDMEIALKLIDYTVLYHKKLWAKITRAIQENCIVEFHRDYDWHTFDFDVFSLMEKDIDAILNTPNERVTQFLARYTSLECVKEAIDLFVKQQNK